MPFKIVLNDITKMKVDAIVNAANTALQMGGGVCGAIFSAAGAKELQDECDRIGYCEVGNAVITKGYRLPAKYIIHTPGPIWRGGNNNEAELLHKCYINSLNHALENNCSSIAFPLISAGIFGYPKDQALKIAVSAITEFLASNEMEVYLVIFSKSDFEISRNLYESIEKYINENYEEELRAAESKTDVEYLAESPSVLKEPEFPLKEYISETKRRLEDLLSHPGETFSEMLLRLIDKKGMTDVETYKRANIDRKLFSKIRCSKNYNPSKETAISLAIALRLNLDETLDLLGKAGYTLSPSSKFDLIIKFFIENGIYDIHEINMALFKYNQPLLGA
ncbi:MAG: RNase III inhibitor [Clostridiaceae bacterium]|nr:RNase III inhibitor [Clostridiaceae bacterium]